MLTDGLTAKEYTPGSLQKFTMVSGKAEPNLDMGFGREFRVKAISGNGWIVRLKGMGYTCGVTGINMRESGIGV